jgi:hypothetical protein
MAEDYIPTVRIRRPAKITTDDRGRTVWAETVETAELELVSTAELQKILASTDDDTRSAIQSIIREEEEGVLARDPATGLFEIISDADLQAILDSNEDLPKTRRPESVTLERASRKPESQDDELSLVSTQVLRKVLAADVPKKTATRGKERELADKLGKDKLGKDKGGGFDPYNSS